MEELYTLIHAKVAEALVNHSQNYSNTIPNFPPQQYYSPGTHPTYPSGLLTQSNMYPVISNLPRELMGLNISGTNQPMRESFVPINLPPTLPPNYPVSGNSNKTNINETSTSHGLTREGSNNKRKRESNGIQRETKNFKAYKTQNTYAGKHPMCNNCKRHHQGLCKISHCERCNKKGHLAKDCRAKLKPKQTQKAKAIKVCFNCGGKDHFKRDCQELSKKICIKCGGVDHSKGDCQMLKQGKHGMCSSLMFYL